MPDAAAGEMPHRAHVAHSKTHDKQGLPLDIWGAYGKIKQNL